MCNLLIFVIIALAAFAVWSYAAKGNSRSSAMCAADWGVPSNYKHLYALPPPGGKLFQVLNQCAEFKLPSEMEGPSDYAPVGVAKNGVMCVGNPCNTVLNKKGTGWYAGGLGYGPGWKAPNKDGHVILQSPPNRSPYSMYAPQSPLYLTTAGATKHIAKAGRFVLK
jgi:hypothetical protein